MTQPQTSEVPNAQPGRAGRVRTAIRLIRSGAARRRYTNPLAIAAIVLLVGIVVPAGGSQFWIYTVTIVGLYATAVVGLNALTGYANQISFATTAFLAIGGYGYALLTTKLGWNPWPALFVAIVVCGVGALLMGVPILRLRGHYLALATFALAIGIFSLATGANSLTGGSIGVSGVPPLTIGSVNFGEPLAAYYLAWVVCALAVLGVAALVASRVGRAWRALGTREDVALSLGVNVRHYKIVAFVISGVLAAVAGALYVQFTTFVSPDLYDTSIAVLVFAMLFIGGLATPYGPLVGTAIVIIVQALMGGLQNLESLIFEIVLLLILVLRPQGLVGRVTLALPLRNIMPMWIRRKKPAR